ncbi:MAG: hydrogenase maturation protease, partial [Gemmatimonadales bacterium]
MTGGCLVGGIGNVVLGDDGFGVAVVSLLASRPLGAGVRIVDFGVRMVDLAYALLEPYERIILIDAVPRGGAPGTLYVIEPDDPAVTPADPPLEGHGSSTAQALAWVRRLRGPG